LSQNLPSLASTLVHVKINDTVLEMATKLHETSSSLLQPGTLYINGRALRFDRPTLNVFELLDLMKEEEASLRELEQRLGPYLSMEQLKAVQEAWIMGDAFLQSQKAKADDKGSGEAEVKDAAIDDKSYRVDVARGGKRAILYLNDVEKDQMYMQWPRSVHQMLMNLQYG
jgi:hypothetical protein